MNLVQTLLVRNDADVVDAQIAYHLNAGVDFVIAADKESGDGATEILARYEREGYLRLIPKDGEAQEAELRTQLARLAASEHRADWVLSTDADEFWWPRGESLKDVLAPIPPRYTIIQGLRRSFVSRPGESGTFSERMTLRRSLQFGLDDGRESPAASLRPLHRADPNVVVRPDGTVVIRRSMPLRAWYPIEVLHFPVGEDAVEDEPAGSLVVDTRLRDALRVLREAAAAEPSPGRTFALPERGTSRLSFRVPDVVDDAAYAVECAAVGEVDLPRLEQYVAELEERVRWLEQRLWPRVLRVGSRLVRRAAR